MGRPKALICAAAARIDFPDMRSRETTLMSADASVLRISSIASSALEQAKANQVRRRGPMIHPHWKQNAHSPLCRSTGDNDSLRIGSEGTDCFCAEGVGANTGYDNWHVRVNRHSFPNSLIAQDPTLVPFLPAI